jgi:hypothetical protein
VNKKKNFSNYSLWWLDTNILNINNLHFKYSYINNIYFFKLDVKFYYYFFLLNSKNINTLNFYILDILNYKNINLNNYFLAYQSIFFDFKLLVETQFDKNISSVSTIYKGASWIERETKEFTSVQYNNLTDSRKLLSNYNYNSNLQYNNFNNIINDLKI